MIDESLARTVLPSPVGDLTLYASRIGLVAILWQDDRPNRVPLSPATDDQRHPILLEAAHQLNEYFDRSRQTFSVPLDLRGTPFQQSVWLALLAIPFGQTATYADLAQQLGNPLATRAVGAANGRNPISIIVPCHRVVGASGKLTGFAGGLQAKRYLLELESHRLNLQPG